MKILLLRTWTTNIGNAFIDKGAREIINQTFPNSEIIEVSGYPNHVSDTHLKYGVGGKMADIVGYSHSKRGSPNHPHRQNCTNIGELIDADLAVLPGCVLSKPTFRKYRKTLENISNREIPIIILGGGGEKYDQNEIEYVSNLLAEFNIDGIITRDRTAHEIYSKKGIYCHDGIDCSLFLDRGEQPPESDTGFVAHTFDKVREPKLGESRKIIRPDHAPFDEPYHFPIIDTLKKVLGIEPSVFDQKNSLISDLYEDYLFVYANSEITRSDRIHACLPTLVYGNQAQFYFETDRANLFDRLPLSGDINKEPVQLEMQKLNQEKAAQIEAFQEMVDEIKVL